MEASREAKLADAVGEIEACLGQYSNPDRALGAKRYLKSDLDFLGVAVPDLRRQVRTWSRHRPALDRLALSELCRALWRRRVNELCLFAIELLRDRQDCLERSDIELLEWMLRRSNTWAYVDAIAVHLVGPMVERFPRLSRELDRWSRDDDFWLRRSAMLALLLPLRRGAGDWKSLRALCGRHAGGEGVLHSQGDRLGAARGEQEGHGESRPVSSARGSAASRE